MTALITRPGCTRSGQGRLRSEIADQQDCHGWLNRKGLTMRILLLIVLVISMTGCSTMSGVAADLQAASKGIAKRAAQD